MAEALPPSVVYIIFLKWSKAMLLKLGIFFVAVGVIKLIVSLVLRSKEH